MSAVAPVTEPGTAGRGFGLLWFGEGVSLLGGATSSVLLPLLAIVSLHAGPRWMGLLAAATWLPWLLVGLPAGAWVDRLPARRVMIAADLVAAVVVASVPVAAWLGVLGLPQLLLVALLSGTCAVFFRTAYAALVPQVVPSAGLERANGRLVGTESCAQIAGPGLAGLLTQAVSAASGLVVDAASYLVSAVCLWRVRPVVRHRPAAIREPLREQILLGLRFVAGDRYLRWLSGLGGLSNLGLTGYQALLVLYLVRELQVPAAAVGVVLALGSSGGVLGAALAAPVARRWGSGRASTWLLVLSGPPALLLPLAAPGPRVAVVVVATFAVGAGVVAGNVVRSSWRQRYVPAGIIGRVVVTMQVVNFGTMPLGGLLAGFLAGSLGTRTAVGLLAGVHLLACLGMLLSPFRALRELPPPRTSA